MAARSVDDSGPTPVTICGRTYYLRGNGDPSYLLELATEVDRKMREVVEATGTADTLNAAILAALNIADECLQARRGSSRRSPDTDARLAHMVTLLDEALVG